MREFNIIANFIIFIAPIWAVLSPHIPVRLIGQFVLLALSISAIWNIEINNTLHLTASNLILKGSIATICLWSIWHTEHEHLKTWGLHFIEQIKLYFWWIK